MKFEYVLQNNITVIDTKTELKEKKHKWSFGIKNKIPVFVNYTRKCTGKLIVSLEINESKLTAAEIDRIKEVCSTSFKSFLTKIDDNNKREVFLDGLLLGFLYNKIGDKCIYVTSAFRRDELSNCSEWVKKQGL